MSTRARLALILGVSAAFAGPILVLRKKFGPWERSWGSTEDEVLRVMPGDDRVSDSEYFTTRAITVNADPEDIYPWLVQMGRGRGGLYSYDFLDRMFGILDAPTAKVILPQFQELRAGDEIPVGKGPGFPVADLKENEYLLLAGETDGTAWTWSTALYPTGDGQTRIVTRNMGAGRAWQRRIFRTGLDLAAFIMVRRWLQVLKQRAEQLHAERAEAAAEAELAAQT